MCVCVTHQMAEPTVCVRVCVSLTRWRSRRAACVCVCHSPDGGADGLRACVCVTHQMAEPTICVAVAISRERAKTWEAPCGRAVGESRWREPLERAVRGPLESR